MLRSAERLSQPHFSEPAAQLPIKVDYLTTSGQPIEPYSTLSGIVSEAESIVQQADAATLRFDIRSQRERQQAVRYESAVQVVRLAHSGNIFALRELPNIVGRHRAEGQSTAERVLLERTEGQRLATQTVRATAQSGRRLEPPTATLLRIGDLMKQTQVPAPYRTTILKFALQDPGTAADYARILQTRVTRPVSR